MKSVIFFSAAAFLSTAFLLAALLAACGGSGGGGNAAGGVDSTLPGVQSTVPANSVSGVSVNTEISAIFTEPIDAATLDIDTFILKDGAGNPVDGNVSYNNGLKEATFTPLSPLAYGTTYTAIITTDIRDKAGNYMSEDYIWSFTTETLADTTRPSVTSTSPPNGAENVALDASISATFTEAMNPLTINTTTFTLVNGIVPVSGVVTYNGVTAVFTPTGDLDADTVYTATITTGAKDLSGNVLAANYVWSFTTGTLPDATAPAVANTVPDDGDTDVALDASISATFTEAMNPLTINTTTFTLVNGIVPVSGTVTYSGVTAVFTPADDLAPDTLYTATITAGAEDLAENPVAENYVWSFTTGTLPDTTAPAVAGTAPDSGEVNVVLDASISATFTEALNPSTVSTATFAVINGTGVAVSGTVTYSGLTAVFTPANPLAVNTPYTATITTGVRDLADNPMASDYSWRFSTGATLDSTAPEVDSVSPADEAINVKIRTSVTATFTEAMNPSTINASTFTVKDEAGNQVAGKYSYSGTTATFNSSKRLAFGTIYTVTITTAVKDLSGNPMAEDYVWSFTTRGRR